MDKYEILDDIIKRNQCLNCKNPNCVKGCPINQPIPEFIDLAKNHKYKEAYEKIIAKSTLPALCGILCPHEKQCEGHCIKGIKSKSIEIGLIEATIANLYHNKIYKLDDKLKDIKIAIIGGGIAGISAAFETIKHGASVTIYEKSSFLGGAVKKNIPPFRFDDRILDDITNQLIKLGVTIMFNHSFDEDIKMIELEEFNYIFFSMGTMNERTSFNKKYNDVYSGNLVLEEFKKNNILPKGLKCIVIGAGNTAMDVSRVFAKNGYDVTIVYRRTLEMAPALKKEIDDTTKDGVKILELMSPDELIYETNTLKGLKVNIMKLLDECDNSGRKKFTKTEETLILETDLIVEAVGSYPNYEIIKKLNLPIFDNGWIRLNQNQNFASFNNYYFIGDYVNGSTTVVNAMKSGISAVKDLIDKEKE